MGPLCGHLYTGTDTPLSAQFLWRALPTVHGGGAA